MTTALDIITSALLKINSIDAGEALATNDFSTGLNNLNRMMRRWEANGLSMGWTDVASPTDVVPMPAEAEDACIYNLALEMAPEYGSNPSPLVVQLAQAYLADLRRDRYVANPIYTKNDAPRAGGIWNIYTDSFGGGW